MTVPARNAHRYLLAIDFGTTFTAAALRTGGTVGMLEIHGSSRTSSAVFADDGGLLLGKVAEQRAAGAPERFERSPKHYLEEGETGLVLGSELLDVRDVIGRILGDVHAEAVRQQDGVPPHEVRLTHPASWSDRRKQLLVESARRGGLPEPVLVPEPEAAAVYLAGEGVTGAPIDDGELVAVYDLGGGTLDTAVLRRSGARFELMGRVGGDPHLGGALFDDRLYRRIGETGLPPDVWGCLQESPEREWQRANHGFREGIRAAKEAVSQAATSPVYVPPPVDRELLVSREELESVIRDDIERSIDILEQTAATAGVDLDAVQRIFLTGGSSRIPLVGEMIRQRLGRADFKGDPKTVVALGAAALERSEETAEPAAPRPPGPPKATEASEGDGPRLKSGRTGRAIAIGAIAVLLAGGAIGVALSQGGDEPNAPVANTSEKRVLTEEQTAREITDILSDASTARISRETGYFDPALESQRKLRSDVKSLTGRTDHLRPELALLASAIERNVTAYEKVAECRDDGCAPEEDAAASEAKERFVEAFDPIAEKYFLPSYPASDL